MKLDKIKFENFRNFKHNEIHLSRKSIHILFDSNGSGKTSIQEGVLWGLSGEINRFVSSAQKSEFGSIDALYGLNAKVNSRINVGLEFKDANSNIFVTRLNRPRRSKSYLTASQKVDQKYFVNDISVDKDEFYHEIELNLGISPDNFQTTNFLSQEIINEALVTDENIRADVFSKILSFDWMQRITELINDEIKSLRDIKKRLNHEASRFQDQINKTELNSLWKELSNIPREIQDQGVIFNTIDKIESSDYTERLTRGFLLQEDEKSQQKLQDLLLKSDDTKSKYSLKIKDLKLLQRKLKSNLDESLKQFGKLESKMNVEDSHEENLLTLISEFKKQEKLIPEKRKQSKKLQIDYDLQNKYFLETASRIKGMDTELASIRKINNAIKTLEIKKSKEFKGIKSSKDISEKITETDKAQVRNQQTLKGLTDFKTQIKPKIKEFSLKINDIHEEKVKLNALNQVDFRLSISHFSKMFHYLNENSAIIKENLQLKSLDNIHNQAQVIIDSEEEISSTDLKNINQGVTRYSQTYPQETMTKTTSLLAQHIQRKNIQSHETDKMDQVNDLVKIYEIKQEITRKKIGALKSEQQNWSNLNSKKKHKGSLAPLISILTLAIAFALIFISGQFPNPQSFVLLLLGILFLSGFVVTIKPELMFSEDKLAKHFSMILSRKKYVNIAANITKSYNNKQTALETEAKEIDLKLKEFSLEKLKHQESQSYDQDLTPLQIDDPRKTLKIYQQAEVHFKKLQTIQESLLDYQIYLTKIELSNKKEETQIAIEKVLFQDIQTKLKEYPGDEINADSLDEIWISFEQILAKLEEEQRTKKGEIKELKVKSTEYEAIEKNMQDQGKLLKKNHQLSQENLSDTIEELENVMKESNNAHQLKEQELVAQKLDLGKINQSVNDLQSQITTHKLGIAKNLAEIGLEGDILNKSLKQITKLIEAKTANLSKDYEKLSLITKQIQTIWTELDLLNPYFDKLELIQSRWRKHAKVIEKAESQLFVIDAKLDNVLELEESWQSVTKALKSSTETITNDIIDVIKEDVINNFQLLGGHDNFNFLDIGIKQIRGKLKVAINVGNNSKNSGAPKALFSNGEQVVLVLALFFAITKRMLENAKFKWIGLDEPSQYLDTDRKEKFCEFLLEFINLYPDTQILLTTADLEFVNIIETKAKDVIEITDFSSVNFVEFSEPEYPEIRLKGMNKQSKPRKSIRRRSVKETEGWGVIKVDEFEIPSKPPGSIVGTGIDVIPEGKDYTCKYCLKSFKSLTYRNICDEAKCISDHRKSMFD